MHRQSRSFKRTVAVAVTAAALAAPVGASAMPADPQGIPAADNGTPIVSSAPREIVVDAGAGTLTVLLLAGGALGAGLAFGVGGSRLVRRHSVAVR